MDLVMTILATVMLTTASAIDLDRSRAVEGFLGQLEDKLSEPSSKIVGGVTAHEGQFPFIVSLKIYNFHRSVNYNKDNITITNINIILIIINITYNYQ